MKDSPLWHPCTAMKSHEKMPPLPVERALGCHLTLKDGRSLFDAISSWWCKSLGHGHPRLRKALMTQMEKFEHVILAGTTNDTIVKLSEQLTTLLPSLQKVFYASDGSCAVEIALKMSVHARVQQHQTHKNQFLCLENGYHGETLGALSVSDLGLYQAPYKGLLFKRHVLRGIPYVHGESDAAWKDAGDAFDQIKAGLDEKAASLTAVIFEPIIQGAGGMKIISADFLRRLTAWAKANDVHVIADEIMTGFARTGKMLASEHCQSQPDFVCLSKGMTSGWLPMSAVVTTNAIYELFYSEDPARAFLHSHTYSGNALAAAVALETLRVIKEERLVDRAVDIGARMRSAMEGIQQETGYLGRVRGMGAMVAADVILPSSWQGSLANKVMQISPQYGVYLRPLGRTLYWMPPLIASDDALDCLAQATKKTLHHVFRGINNHD